MEKTVEMPNAAEENAPTLEEQAAMLQDDGSLQEPESTPTPTEGGEENLILGKFKTQEDLAEAYQQLQAKMGESKTEDAPAQETPKAETEGLEIEPPTDQETQSSAIQKASQEFWDNGEISEDSYKALEDMGISKEIVDQYAAGVQAQQSMQQMQAQQVETQVFESVGGKDNYQQMADWAKSNLSEGELNAFNENVNSGDINKINLAVNSLYNKFQSNSTVEPKNQLTGMAAQTGVEAFGSDQEMVNAMSDTRYHTDPSYRKTVDAKVAAML